jgi:hypothetical protein
MFWAPVELALGNFLVSGVFMMIGFAFDLNPLWAISLLVINHIILAVVGSREPHAFNILKCIGQANRPTNNLVKTKGNKFVA